MDLNLFPLPNWLLWIRTIPFYLFTPLCITVSVLGVTLIMWLLSKIIPPFHNKKVKPNSNTSSED